MSDDRTLLSVGLDVGTTTTQIVFSRIHLRNIAPSSQVPRIGIGDRDILYQSQIFFTPLATRDRVDVRALEHIVEKEYAKANFLPSQVETGAVIVTGEIAKKENAAEILDALGKYAGEFVVTVAGPRLEAQMAGRGSGAAAYSRGALCAGDECGHWRRDGKQRRIRAGQYAGSRGNECGRADYRD